MRNHYNAIFLMCANKENKFSLTPCPFSFKELWLFGISAPPPKLLVLSQEVGDDQIHTKVFAVQGQPRHPHLFTVSYWVFVIAVNPSIRNIGCSRQWKVLKQFLVLFCYFKVFISTLHSAQLSKVHHSIQSPASQDLGSWSSSKCFLKR